MSETTKQCGQCGQTKAALLFNKRAASIDGLSACCKDCQRDYDFARLHKPDRVASRIAYRKTPSGKERLNAGSKAWVRRNSEKRKCHETLGNAIRDGKIIRKPCEICGNTKTEAHHEDYSKPLAISWLCTKHHIELHKQRRGNAGYGPRK